MIISKKALQVVAVTTVDKSIPVLDNVHINPDGSIVGGNREGVIVVSPIQKGIKKSLALTESITESLSLSSETIRDIIKFIGVDKKNKGLLEHVDISRTEDDNGQITMYDGKRPKAMQTKIYPYEYFDYKELVQRTYGKKKSVRLVLNRKRLLSLLITLEKICSDGSDFGPVYLEFTEENDLIMRIYNAVNGQRALGICRGFKTDKWLDQDEWEKQLTGKEGSYVRSRKKKKAIKESSKEKDNSVKQIGFIRQRRKKTS